MEKDIKRLKKYLIIIPCVGCYFIILPLLDKLLGGNGKYYQSAIWAGIGLLFITAVLNVLYRILSQIKNEIEELKKK